MGHAARTRSLFVIEINFPFFGNAGPLLPSYLGITGSSFDLKATDGSDLFTLYNNSDEVSIQFDDKVLVLGETTGAPPTAVAGGMYYSGSNEWFLGYENSPT